MVVNKIHVLTLLKYNFFFLYIVSLHISYGLKCQIKVLLVMGYVKELLDLINIVTFEA